MGSPLHESTVANRIALATRALPPERIAEDPARLRMRPNGMLSNRRCVGTPGGNSSGPAIRAFEPVFRVIQQGDRLRLVVGAQRGSRSFHLFHQDHARWNCYSHLPRRSLPAQSRRTICANHFSHWHILPFPGTAARASTFTFTTNRSTSDCRSHSVFSSFVIMLPCGRCNEPSLLVVGTIVWTVHTSKPSTALQGLFPFLLQYLSDGVFTPLWSYFLGT